MHSNIFFAAYGEFCEIGELKSQIVRKIYKLDQEIKHLAISKRCNLAFTSTQIINYTKSFEEFNRINIEGIDEIICSKIIEDSLILSCKIKNHYFLHFLNLRSLEILQSNETDESILNINFQKNLYILLYNFKVVLINKQKELVVELKFQNQEYDDLSKKLDKADIQEIIELGISNQLQQIVDFFFINSGRTVIEQLEQEGKEFICITTNYIYWGIVKESNSYHINTFMVNII